jgi:hypothetical protein
MYGWETRSVFKENKSVNGGFYHVIYDVDH